MYYPLQCSALSTHIYYKQTHNSLKCKLYVCFHSQFGNTEISVMLLHIIVPFGINRAQLEQSLTFFCLTIVCMSLYFLLITFVYVLFKHFFFLLHFLLCLLMMSTRYLLIGTYNTLCIYFCDARSSTCHHGFHSSLQNPTF